MALSSCGSDAWFGSGPGAEASVTTPSGVQSGLVNLSYTLKSEDVSKSDVQVSYSKDGGSFRRATAGPGGSGTRGLSVSTFGDAHSFVWDSGADLDGDRASSVVIRVQPDGGTGDLTAPISVHNLRYLLAVENQASGSVRLYLADVVDGSLLFRRAFSTGGTDPYDVIFERGFFLVVHRTTNDVAVFQIDEGNQSLIEVEDSPFSGDGSGAKYLVSDGDHVFASNATGNTITVFDFDSSTGKLTLNTHSGASAAGCRAMVVRSARLYVASETTGSILIFDIASNGELLENGASPVSTGGLSSPRALGFSSTRLYAANASTASICGFNFLGGGDLSPLSGSPFSVTNSGIEALSRNGSKLFAATGTVESLLSFTIDSFGALTEDTGSPFSLTGPSFTVVSAGSAVFASTTTSEDVLAWTIDGLGDLSTASSSPMGSGVEILRTAISD